MPKIKIPILFFFSTTPLSRKFSTSPKAIKDKGTEEIDNDLWINLKLDEFYNNKKIDPENKKIFENLKK